MKKICIVVGHSAVDGGCYNKSLGLNEYDYNHVLASELAANLHRRNVCPVIIYRGSSYTSMVNDVNKTQADFAIELHCNGVSDHSVKGAETLYCGTSTNGKRMAEIVQKAVHGLMNESNRGIKPKSAGDRGWTFLKNTLMPAIILEPFFLSCDESAELGVTLRSQLANVLAGALVEHVTNELASGAIK